MGAGRVERSLHIPRSHLREMSMCSSSRRSLASRSSSLSSAACFFLSPSVSFSRTSRGARLSGAAGERGGEPGDGERGERGVAGELGSASFQERDFGRLATKPRRPEPEPDMRFDKWAFNERRFAVTERRSCWASRPLSSSCRSFSCISSARSTFKLRARIVSKRSTAQASRIHWSAALVSLHSPAFARVTHLRAHGSQD